MLYDVWDVGSGAQVEFFFHCISSNLLALVLSVPPQGKIFFCKNRLAESRVQRSSTGTLSVTNRVRFMIVGVVRLFLLGV